MVLTRGRRSWYCCHNRAGFCKHKTLITALYTAVLTTIIISTNKRNLWESLLYNRHTMVKFTTTLNVWTSNRLVGIKSINRRGETGSGNMYFIPIKWTPLFWNTVSEGVGKQLNPQSCPCKKFKSGFSKQLNPRSCPYKKWKSEFGKQVNPQSCLCKKQKSRFGKQLYPQSYPHKKFKIGFNK
jgi:hypothetical protein